MGEVVQEILNSYTPEGAGSKFKSAHEPSGAVCKGERGKGAESRGLPGLCGTISENQLHDEWIKL